LATYRTRTVRIATVAASASLLGALVLPGTGQAQPKLSLAQAQAKVAALQDQAEMAQERVYQTQMALAARQRTLGVLNGQVVKAEAAFHVAQRSIGQLAAIAYRSGGVDQTLQLLLAEDPSQFLAQASMLSSVSKREADILRAGATAKDRLAQTKLAVAQEVGRLQQLRDQASQDEARVKSLVRQAQDVLNSLQAAQRAELARQQTAARAAQLVQQRALAAANTPPAPRPSAPRGPSKPSVRPPTGSRPPGGGGGSVGGNASIGERALNYALAQVGKSYVYAGVGPRSYDCSGLTMMAYRSVGIYLPRYGGWGGQADVGRRIPLSQLRPGDLILYYPPSLHHITMYAGHGEIVHAANPRDGVEISPMNSMPIAFAVRPYKSAGIFNWHFERGNTV
jgi:peptidoglycan DL-endopeptidase CwlO